VVRVSRLKENLKYFCTTLFHLRRKEKYPLRYTVKLNRDLKFLYSFLLIYYSGEGGVSVV
jgi:hypothetical protein